MSLKLDLIGDDAFCGAIITAIQTQQYLCVLTFSTPSEVGGISLWGSRFGKTTSIEIAGSIYGMAEFRDETIRTE
jgi:hypothetical protein